MTGNIDNSPRLWAPSKGTLFNMPLWLLKLLIFIEVKQPRVLLQSPTRQIRSLLDLAAADVTKSAWEILAQVSPDKEHPEGWFLQQQ